MSVCQTVCLFQLISPRWLEIWMGFSLTENQKNNKKKYLYSRLALPHIALANAVVKVASKKVFKFTNE